MRNLLILVTLFSLTNVCATSAWARKIQVDERRVATGTPDQDEAASTTNTEYENPAPRRRLEYGERAARKHFVRRSQGTEEGGGGESSGGSITAETHYLALHFGGYVSSSSWVWDGDHTDNPGRLTFGVTYRVGEWTRSMDLNFRGDFSTYQQRDGGAFKLSLLPLITFPDASSKFPLYFGVGAGLGIYFQQIQGQQGSSPLSVDYQLIAGARFFNVTGSAGFLVEGGIKNSLHLTNSGQFNGAFAAVGAVFTF